MRVDVYLLAAMLFHTVLPVTPADTAWYALHVRSNHERITSTALRSKDYEEFLPVYRRFEGDKQSERPLFTGYVFARFDARRRTPILSLPGVVQIVGFGRTPAPIDDAEIEAIRAVVASGLPALPCPFLEIGQRVAIEKGPLAGLEGLLVEMKSRCRLVVSVSMLRRSVGVEIQSDWVRPVAVAPASRALGEGASRQS